MTKFLSGDTPLTLLQNLRQQTIGHIQAQRWAQAADSLHALTTVSPGDVWALQLQVVMALALQQPVQAARLAKEALKLLPGHEVRARANVLFNLGQACGLLGQPVAALQAFEQVLAAEPGDPAALLAKAKALALLGEHGRAGAAVTEVLEKQPDNLEALALLANSLLNVGAHAQALERFLQYERIKPASPFTACMVVFLMRQLADWSVPMLQANAQELTAIQNSAALGQRSELALLALRAWQNMPALEPFSTLVLYDDPALQRHCAQLLLKHMHPPAVPATGNGADVASQASRGKVPIKVAYVSCEFKEHATSYLLAGVLARHDRERVQVFLLSYAPPRAEGPDAMQQRIATMGHTWVDIHLWSDEQVAQWCREQGIDVAVDLKGLTRDSRTGIFAHRAAPVQVNWLGYPGTLPAPYYDWILADAQVLPVELESHFEERVWRLPNSYQPNDPDRVIDSRPQRRADHGLPEGGVVLVCFNNVFKITPEVWTVWMELLKARPDSVLWLQSGPDAMRKNLQSHAREAGVDPSRLVFAPILPQAQHLARLALADLSLDTYPYNAHTTASDALWAGVPHIALTGRSFAARVGASVLSAAGMPELITHGLVEYEMLAKRLLRDDAARCNVRERLAALRPTAPLWDAQGFASALVQAFEGMLANR